MIILKIWMSVVMDVFRHMFYHKCMIILVAVFQNNKESAVFSLDKVYSGIDLCMKIGLNSSMYLYPFYTNLLPPTPTALTSISMFVPVVHIYFMFHEWQHCSAIHCVVRIQL